MKDYLKNVLEEFDKFFVTIGAGTSLNSKEEVIAQKEKIKDFISQALTNYGLELKREIEKLKIELPYPNASNMYQKNLGNDDKIFNNALDEALALPPKGIEL